MDYQQEEIDRQKLSEDQKRELRLQEKQRAEDIAWLMSGPRGRRILRHLLANAGVWRQTFNSNAMQMAFAEGRRNEGLWLLDQLQRHSKPEDFAALMADQGK